MAWEGPRRGLGGPWTGLGQAWPRHLAIARDSEALLASRGSGGPRMAWEGPRSPGSQYGPVLARPSQDWADLMPAPKGFWASTGQ